MIKELSSLRFIFICFIFLHHTSLYAGGGTMAVTFFFVLGGFAMTLGYKDKVLKEDFSYREYIKKRFIKFYPLHWICLLAAVPFVVTHFILWQIPNFIINAFLVQTWIPLQSIYFSYNSVSWYLANTVFFTLMFPFIFKVVATADRQRNLTVFAIMTVCYVSLICFLPERFYHAIFYINPLVRLIDFIIGIYTAFLFLNLKECDVVNKIISKTHILSKVFIIGVIVFLIVLSNILTENQRTMAVFYWIPICLILLTTSILSGYKGNQTNVLVYLGECSFEFFMVHQLIIRYSKTLFEKVLHIDNTIVFVVICFSITIVASIVIHNYVVKNITKWLTKKIQPSMTVQ